MGWLDKLPTWARDLILMVGASILGWIGSDLVPLLEKRGGISALAASVLLLIVGALTPLTRAYGPCRPKKVGGQEDPTDEPPDSL